MDRTGAIILLGCAWITGSILGAGSVVSKDVPARAATTGVSTGVIREK